MPERVPVQVSPLPGHEGSGQKVSRQQRCDNSDRVNCRARANSDCRTQQIKASGSTPRLGHVVCKHTCQQKSARRTGDPDQLSVSVKEKHRKTKGGRNSHTMEKPVRESLESPDRFKSSLAILVSRRLLFTCGTRTHSAPLAPNREMHSSSFRHMLGTRSRPDNRGLRNRLSVAKAQFSQRVLLLQSVVSGV